jgi:anti-sigma factor RsiW
MDDDAGGRDPGELDARDAARVRRRDRDANAAARELMRPGMGKVFKQILDSQASAAKEPPQRRKKRRA